jgi:hypothetical protein
MLYLIDSPSVESCSTEAKCMPGRGKRKEVHGQEPPAQAWGLV